LNQQITQKQSMIDKFSAQAADINARGGQGVAADALRRDVVMAQSELKALHERMMLREGAAAALPLPPQLRGALQKYL
jgi:hypothetical protein